MNHAYTIYPCHDMEPGCAAHDSRLLNREARSAPSGQSLVRNSDQHGQVLADPPQPTGSTAHASLQATAHELDHVRYTGHPIAQCSGTCSAKGQLGSMGPVTSPADHAVCGAEEPVPVLCRINEAVTLFNGTPLGRVLNERQLLRHRTHANQTFVAGDRHRHTVRIDVLRYVAWLVDRLHAGIDDHPLDGEITYPGVYALLAQQDYRCALTGRRLRPEDASLDHVIPVSRHGTHRLENAQVLHQDVNRAKGALTNPEFIALCRDVVAWVDQHPALATSEVS